MTSIRAGFGHALVPVGIARAMGVSPQKFQVLDRSLTRPVSLVARTRTLARPVHRKFWDACLAAARTMKD